MTRILDFVNRLNLPVPEIDWLTSAGPDVAPFFHAVPDVAERTEVAYRTDTAAESRHRLNIYAPVGRRDVPVLVFVHGGSWVFGTKDWYAPLARSLARVGICVVLPNYRLSPFVRHPAHVEDVTAAVRWVRDHIGEHGGDATRLFVGGHSAGGHLTALAAFDPTYGLTGTIRGVVGLAGVYQLNARMPGYGLVFGDRQTEGPASPMSHVKPGGPAVLAVYADHDYPTLDRQAEELAAAVRAAGGDGRALRVHGPDHVTLVVDAASPKGRAHAAIRGFVLGEPGA